MDTVTKAIIDLDAKVSPVILSSIFGCNVSLVYQDVEAGKLPRPVIDYTYRQCIQFNRKYHTKNIEVKLAKEANDQKLKEAKLVEDIKFRESKLRANEALEEAARKRKEDFRTQGSEGTFEEGLPPLLAAKARQDIRLSIAREQQIWIKAAMDRGEFISAVAMTELCEPIISSIRQTLLSLALTSKEAEAAIDFCMENLYSLGIALTEQAKFDSDNFIDAIMKKDIDTTEIDVDTLPEPIL